jgi:hypothetical protein
MKPKPRVTLKNFTVPVVISHAFLVIRTRHAPARGMIDLTSHLKNGSSASGRARSILNPMGIGHSPVYGNSIPEKASIISLLFLSISNKNLYIAAIFCAFLRRLAE